MEDKNKFISEYIKGIDKTYRQGGTSEHSFRHILYELLQNITTGFTIINEPERRDYGAPDYVLKKENMPIGFIETKKIDEDINNKKFENQFNKYKEALSNIIITNYIYFQYYKDDNLILEATIGEKKDGKIVENKNAFKAFLEMVDMLINYKGQIITKSEILAKLMARKTKLLSELLYKNITNKNNEDNSLKEQMQTFKDYLIHDLTENVFADIYSQTIAYGLFAAKLYDKKKYPFSRFSVSELIPESNYFLRKFYHYIMGTDIDDNIGWFIDMFADMFKFVDIKKIKKEFEDKEQDPYIYFYETFLNEYDKKEKKERGVYYTPISVVKFIVNSVDIILKKYFNLEKGLADNSKIKVSIKDKNNNVNEVSFHKVQILDPATGTGTFLAEVINKIFSYFDNNKGMWNDYCEKDLINRIHGFEYMMASYVMANLKIDMKLKETGFNINNVYKKRLGIYLTNTLEDANEIQYKMDLAKWLTEEAAAAREVKINIPVMVVLGNPPYNAESKNKYDDDMYIKYKYEPKGINKLDELNIKPLNDDYVKFIAYGHGLIKKYNEGILAFINNNGFLDNKTFRGMRWQLLNTFDEIYIVNLYGDVEKNKNNEKMKNDENVFNIKKGVSINIFINNGKKKLHELANVYYTEIIGSREKKYLFLSGNDLNKIKWKKINLASPYYFFINKEYKDEEKYNEGFVIKELFKIGSDGIVTSRDEFTISETIDELKERIKDFLSLDNERAREKYNLGEDTRDWKIKYAKKDLVPNPTVNKEPDFNKLTEIYYRPFDIRYTYYTGNSRGFHSTPRGKVMKHFLEGNNYGLIIKQGLNENASPVFISKYIIDKRSWSRSGMIGGDHILPLYLYLSKDNTERQSNFNSAIVEKIEKSINLKFVDEKSNKKDTFAPIDILDYIYAVLYSNNYRKNYEGQLKTDYPRIKYPKGTNEFISLALLGKTLRELHLMENLENIKNTVNYPISGNDEVDKIEYENGKVYINVKQYFEKISQEVWDYFIGGYQPARKWIKERKGKILTYEQKKHYMNIIYVIEETIKIQEKIDEVIEI
jgi:predicted helicase